MTASAPAIYRAGAGNWDARPTGVPDYLRDCDLFDLARLAEWAGAMARADATPPRQRKRPLRPLTEYERRVIDGDNRRELAANSRRGLEIARQRLAERARK